jgi:hypothetical protein
MGEVKLERPMVQKVQELVASVTSAWRKEFIIKPVKGSDLVAFTGVRVMTVDFCPVHTFHMS